MRDFVMGVILYTLAYFGAACMVVGFAMCLEFMRVQ